MNRSDLTDEERTPDLTNGIEIISEAVIKSSIKIQDWGYKASLKKKKKMNSVGTQEQERKQPTVLENKTFLSYKWVKEAGLIKIRKYLKLNNDAKSVSQSRAMELRSKALRSPCLKSSLRTVGTKELSFQHSQGSDEKITPEKAE